MSDVSLNAEFCGAVLVDKPSGITSFDVLRILKREKGIKKLGHAGTLDPLATGLLVVLCGKASRLQDMFLNADKEYEAEILFGTATDTDDIEGQVVKSCEVDLMNSAAEHEQALRSAFRGPISQLPPKFSAIKKDGKPLYERARQGEEVVVEPREVIIRSADFNVIDSNKVAARVSCSKGTYIRSIARDAGELLQSAACISKLRRLRSGDFSVDDALSIDELSAEKQRGSALLSIEQLAKMFRRIVVGEAAAVRLSGGDQRPLEDPAHSSGSEEDPYASLWSSNDELIGFLEWNTGTGRWKLRFVL